MCGNLSFSNPSPATNFINPINFRQFDGRKLYLTINYVLTSPGERGGERSCSCCRAGRRWVPATREEGTPHPTCAPLVLLPCPCPCPRQMAPVLLKIPHGRDQNPVHYWREGSTTGQQLRKISEQLGPAATDPAIPPLGILPEELKAGTQGHIAHSRAQQHKQLPRGRTDPVSMDGGRGRSGVHPDHGMLPSPQTKATPTYTTPRTALEDITLSEVRQSQDKHYVVPPPWGT